MKKISLTNVLGLICTIGTIGLTLLNSVVEDRKMHDTVAKEVQAQLTQMNK